MKPQASRLICVIILLGLFAAHVQAQNETPFATTADPFLYLKVQLDRSKRKVTALRPGDMVEGTLVRGAYWRERKVFPAGSRAHLVVDHLEHRRRARNDHWPWAINAFLPRHEKYPVFRSAQMLMPDGRTIDLQVSLLSVGEEVSLRAHSGEHEPHSQRSKGAAGEATLRATFTSDGTEPNAKRAGVVANLLAVVNAVDFAAASDLQFVSSAERMTIPAGTEARVVLLDGVSASKSNSGDAFQAQLIEPISIGPSIVFPAGSVLEGRIAKVQKPRMMSRSGSLLLSFTSIANANANGANADGTAQRIDASVVGFISDRASHSRVDAEGEIHGERPGAAWTLINLGVAGGLAKVADDSTQLILQAIVSTATDASTAGTSRIVAACVSGAFMLTRHGRDVVLPKFTELNITFNRPVSLSAPSAGGHDSAAAQSRSQQ